MTIFGGEQSFDAENKREFTERYLRVGVGRGGNEGHRERHLRKVSPPVEGECPSSNQG